MSDEPGAAGEQGGLVSRLRAVVGAKDEQIAALDLDVPKPGKPMAPEWAAIPGVTDGADVLAVLCERHGQPWPVTYWVRTPSGGQHLYFRAIPGRPMPCSQGTARTGLGPMIDVKAAGGDGGGYVIGPGSFIGGGKYEVIHDQEPELFPVWLADLLDPPGRPVSDHPRPAYPGAPGRPLRAHARRHRPPGERRPR